MIRKLMPSCSGHSLQHWMIPSQPMTWSHSSGQGAAGAAVRAVLDKSPNLAPGYEAVRRAADTAGAEQRVDALYF